MEIKKAVDLVDSMQFLKRDKADPFGDVKPQEEPEADAPETNLQAKPKVTLPVDDEDVDTTYARWAKKPNPELMHRMITKLRPTLSSSMISYAGGDNPVLRGRAKKLAVDAIKSYKPDNKTTLKSWVSLNLQGLQRHAAAMTPMQAPERVRIDNSRIYKTSQEFLSIHNRTPTDDELADLTSLSPKRINYVRKMMVPVVSEGQFNVDSGDDGDTSIIPGIDSNEWQNVWAEYVYNDLDPVNKKIFDMRMGRGEYTGKTLSVGDIAKELKISSAAVSQRTNKIADKLAEAFDMKGKI